MKNFNFKKKYGQNFLKNEKIAEKIVSSISPKRDDLIIEIGPGGGALTRLLKRYGATLYAYEIDEDTKDLLHKLEDDKTKIFFKDFMTTNLKSEIDFSKFDKIYVVGNLPYYITTPLIEHIIDENIQPEEIVVMVQKEVADRFSAKPHTKDYGYMTVLLNYHFEISRIVEVPRENFIPAPKVDSTVIKLKKKEKESLDYGKFKTLLKDAFQFKRKTISNNLTGYNKSILEDTLKKHGFTLTNRAEDLDLDTFIDLTKNL